MIWLAAILVLGIVTAFVIYHQIIRPAQQLARVVEAILPILTQLSNELNGEPAVLHLLNKLGEISGELGTKLDIAAAAAELVAADLEDAHVRAELITSETPGEAADAAMQRPQGEV